MMNYTNTLCPRRFKWCDFSTNWGNILRIQEERRMWECVQSSQFKSSLLVLFGPYTKKLLCKFEKDQSKCVVDVVLRHVRPGFHHYY